MRIVFICQTVDERGPTQAGTIRWLAEFAARPEVDSITVIALRKGTFNLPSHVDVRAIGGGSRLTTVLRLYREVVRSAWAGLDLFFVYQSGPYPWLLLPFRLILRKPVYQWMAHPAVSPMMRFNARFADRKVFTSTSRAFPLDLDNIAVVGQGIDTERFRIGADPKTGDLVTVGRVSPVKRLESTIRAVARCNSRHGTSYRLDVLGPTFDGDRSYRAALDDLVEGLGSSSAVSFCGAVSHDALPGVLNRYRLFVSFNDGAMDRAMVEAMACGLPVVTPNRCVEEVLPDDLKGLLMVSDDDPDEQADRIVDLLGMGDERLAEIGRRLRHVVVRDHDITGLTNRIFAEMAT